MTAEVDQEPVSEPSADAPAPASDDASPADVARKRPSAYRRAREDARPLVVIRELTKSFLHMGRELEVLKSIDLDIHEGEIVAIVGKSGAGKSTLLQCIGTLDMPTTGVIRLGEDYLVGLSGAELARTRNHMIGFVFQFHHLLPEFNALENVMMPGLIQGLPRAQVTKRAQELLDDVGLGHRVTHRPGELSGGEQQRVALARALLLKPKLILADEPTGNLDTATSDAIHNLFFDINDKHGTTIVVVTHNTKLAESMPRIINMRDGRVDHDSSPPKTRFEVDPAVLDKSRALAKVRFSTFWNRAGARIVDENLLGIVGLVAFLAVVGAQLNLWGTTEAAMNAALAPLLHPLAIAGIVIGMSLLRLIAQGVGEFSGGGATIGKLLFGLRVRMENLDKPRIGPSIVRNLLMVVDGLFGGLVAYLGIGSSLLRQRFGDGLAQTVVVDARTLPEETVGGAARGIASGLLTSAALHALFALLVLALV